MTDGIAYLNFEGLQKYDELIKDYVNGQVDSKYSSTLDIDVSHISETGEQKIKEIISDEFMDMPFGCTSIGWTLNSGKTYIKYELSSNKPELRSQWGVIYVQSNVSRLPNDIWNNLINSTPDNYGELGLKKLSSTNIVDNSYVANLMFLNPAESISYSHIYIKPYIISNSGKVRYLPVQCAESQITLYNLQQLVGDINAVLEAVL